jgi:hypothetical protein
MSPIHISYRGHSLEAHTYRFTGTRCVRLKIQPTASVPYRTFVSVVKQSVSWFGPISPIRFPLQFSLVAAPPPGISESERKSSTRG